MLQIVCQDLSYRQRQLTSRLLLRFLIKINYELIGLTDLIKSLLFSYIFINCFAKDARQTIPMFKSNQSHHGNLSSTNRMTMVLQSRHEYYMSISHRELIPYSSESNIRAAAHKIP